MGLPYTLNPKPLTVWGWGPRPKGRVGVFDSMPNIGAFSPGMGLGSIGLRGDVKCTIKGRVRAVKAPIVLPLSLSFADPARELANVALVRILPLGVICRRTYDSKTQ